jgi:hypothetical protein
MNMGTWNANQDKMKTISGFIEKKYLLCVCSFLDGEQDKFMHRVTERVNFYCAWFHCICHLKSCTFVWIHAWIVVHKYRLLVASLKKKISFVYAVS